ncbi:hypothetical protein INT47_006453, partial [Mucor saturninus]
CCGGNKGPKWKREVVKDHKFNYIDIREFRDDSISARFSYVVMFVIIIKNILTMTADLYTAISLLVIGNASINADASIPPEVAKWIFLGAILISFILLFWDIIKSRSIIASKDISLAFFSAIANGWYSTKDYNYFCLFRKINDSRKSIDSIAFFVFFTLKSWKRILLAEAPRQVINIVTLVTIIPKWINISDGLKLEYNGLGKTRMQQIMTGTMIFSVVVFAISFILICAAAIIYIPLLCHIQGNLKEYCCHKVDKRIEELLKKQAQKRIKGDNLTKKSKKNDIEMHSLAQPTLPKVNMSQVPPNKAPYSHHQQQNSYSSQSNHNYGHSQQPSYSSQGHTQQPSYSNQVYGYQQPVYNTPNSSYGGQPVTGNHHRPGFYQQSSSSNVSAVMDPPYVGRRNSLSSVTSDQVGLTSHAQPQPRSSPYNNISNNIHHQQYQQSPSYHQQQQQQQYQNQQNYY